MRPPAAALLLFLLGTSCSVDTPSPGSSALGGGASALGEVPYVLPGTLVDNDEYAARRARLMDEVSDGAVIIPGATSSITGDRFFQTNDFLYFTGLEVANAYVDKGYRGHDYVGQATVHIAGTSRRKLTRTEKARRKRRSAVEPKIGHLKQDHRMGRCFLRGLAGDAINATLAAAGANLRKLLNLEAAALCGILCALLKLLGFGLNHPFITFGRRSQTLLTLDHHAIIAPNLASPAT